MKVFGGVFNILNRVIKVYDVVVLSFEENK